MTTEYYVWSVLSPNFPLVYRNLLVGFHIDDFDAQHSPIKDKVTSFIKDDINEPDTIHLLQLSLRSHSPSKLHVRQLLSHLLELCKHLT